MGTNGAKMTAGPGVALVLSRWHDPRFPLDLTFAVSDVPELVETQVLGDIRLQGHADLTPKEIVVHLQVTCRTRELCSRSLEEFEYDLSFPFVMLLRRKAHMHDVQWMDEEGDETFVLEIPEEIRELDITEALRQAIELERPISPIREGAPLPDGMQNQDREEEPEEAPQDPRWDALRKLKGL
jgi:uncharacterized metal-binding protein YceD (DUF177 family)